jgi:hypothetical protein
VRWLRPPHSPPGRASLPAWVSAIGEHSEVPRSPGLSPTARRDRPMCPRSQRPRDHQQASGRSGPVFAGLQAGTREISPPKKPALFKKTHRAVSRSPPPSKGRETTPDSRRRSIRTQRVTIENESTLALMSTRYRNEFEIEQSPYLADFTEISLP